MFCPSKANLIVLKDKAEYGFVPARSGLTSQKSMVFANFGETFLVSVSAQAGTGPTLQASKSLGQARSASHRSGSANFSQLQAQPCGHEKRTA